MKIAVGIVTTEGREDSLQKTLASLKSSPDCPPIQVFKDLEKGLYPNHVASWKKLFEESKYAFLMQDDIIACKNWFSTVELFGKKFHYDIISFYTNLGVMADKESIEKGYCCAGGGREFPDVALFLTRDFYFKYLDYAEKNPDIKERHQIKRRKGDFHHDDTLNDYAKITKTGSMLVTPPLFQHIGETSTVGNPWTPFGKVRQSALFRGEDWNSYKHFKEII